jgi:hypothetical protein
MSVIGQELECQGPIMDGRIKGHVYIIFKARNKDFYLLCYMASNESSLEE